MKAVKFLGIIFLGLLAAILVLFVSGTINMSCERDKKVEQVKEEQTPIKPIVPEPAVEVPEYNEKAEAKPERIESQVEAKDIIKTEKKKEADAVIVNGYYEIEKGDTLSEIGEKLNISWQVLYWENRETIENPDKIYPGQKIKIPEKKYWVWQKLMGNPFKGTLEDGLSQLKTFDPDINTAFLEQYKEEDYETIKITQGTTAIATIFGPGIVKRDILIWWEDTVPLYTARIERETETVECTLLYPKCGNPTPFKECVRKPKPVAPPEEEAPPPVKEEIISPPKKKLPEIPKKAEAPPVILKAPQVYKPPKIFKYKPIKCIDFELNARQGFWWGEESHGEFSYAEGGVWDSCWYWGKMAGFYATRDSGKTDAGYKWESGIENLINPGIQVGVRYLDFYKKDDGSVLPHGWTAKVRLLYAKITGKNPQTLYHMTQEDLLIGIYGEYIRFLSQNTVAALTFEAWFSLWSKQESTWSGDSPSNRGWIQIGAYIQKYISDRWAIRLGGYGFYHLWDEEFGIGGYPEIRYNDWLLAGFNASLGFDNGLSYGPYIGGEFGTLKRMARDRKIVDQIVVIDDDGNPIKEGGEESKDSVITEDETSSDDIKEIELKESPINTPIF